MTRRLACFLQAAFLIGLAVAAYPADDDYVRLARLSYIEGHVSLQYSSDVEWSAASINMPLEPGDRIYTGRDGKTEIEFDDGSVYRLAEDTDIEILSLNENLIQLRILTGLSTLTVSSGLDFEIDTPAAAFSTIRQGTYRFEVTEKGETAAIVRKGELEAANNEFVSRIQTGDRMSIRVDGHKELARYYGRDAWDEWNDRREADRWAYQSREYLPDTVYIGTSDLDRYGRWVQVESYGTAWVPFSVGVSWSPYSVGRWCYRPFYGWTWVSYEPWGWLPYHYGRWYRSAGFGWCWLPGPSFSFNFWSPGLVAFYSGPGWVSWCPLGPGDYYNINHYHYNHRVNGYQLAKLRGLHSRPAGQPFYRNDRGAFRSVSRDQFRNGSLRGNGVATRRGYVNTASRQGSFVRDRLDIKPTRASFSGAPDRPSTRPRSNSSLPAVVRTNPRGRADNRGGFTRITNPQISSSSARAARERNDTETRGRRSASDPAVREVQFGAAERTDSRARNQAGSNSPGASGGRTAVPRNSRSSASTAGTSANSRNAVQTGRSQNNASSNAQRGPTVRYRSVIPERDEPAAASRSRARPRVETSGQSTTRSSSSGVRSSTARAPVTGRSGAYSAPPQSNSFSQGNRNASSGSQARTRVQPQRQITTPSPSVSSSGRRSIGSSSVSRAPATAGSKGYSVPRRSTSSPQRNSAVRSSGTPSRSGSSVRSAQPRVQSRPSGSSMSSRSSGQAQRSGGSAGRARRK